MRHPRYRPRQAFGCSTRVRSSSVVRIVVSDPAVDLIAGRGGRLYVWLKRDRCCGGITRLVTASEPPSLKAFRRVGAYEGFELHMPAGLAAFPTSCTSKPGATPADSRRTGTAAPGSPDSTPSAHHAPTCSGESA